MRQKKNERKKYKERKNNVFDTMWLLCNYSNIILNCIQHLKQYCDDLPDFGYQARAETNFVIKLDERKKKAKTNF